MIFMRFSHREANRLQPWQEHCSRVTGRIPAVEFAVDPQPKSDPSVVVWHLVSGNNRVLARSAAIYSSLDQATTGALEMSRAGESLAITQVFDQIRSVYGWYGSIADRAVITCSRWYGSERDRRQAIDLAVISFRGAVIQSEARIIAPDLSSSLSRVDRIAHGAPFPNLRVAGTATVPEDDRGVSVTHGP